MHHKAYWIKMKYPRLQTHRSFPYLIIFRASVCEGGSLIILAAVLLTDKSNSIFGKSPPDCKLLSMHWTLFRHTKLSSWNCKLLDCIWWSGRPSWGRDTWGYTAPWWMRENIYLSNRYQISKSIKQTKE